MAVAGLALAAARPAAATTTVPTPGEGTLLIAKDGRATPEALPVVSTHVVASVVGFVAQVRVRQTFNNPFDRPLEAIQNVRPLPALIGKRLFDGGRLMTQPSEFLAEGHGSVGGRVTSAFEVDDVDARRVGLLVLVLSSVIAPNGLPAGRRASGRRTPEAPPEPCDA